MDNTTNILKHFKKTLDDLIIREMIRGKIKNYNDESLYVIFEDGSVFPFNEEIIDINKNFEGRKKYIISRPVKI